MGDRGHVKVIQWGEKPVYLYTHWGGSELIETVKTALKRKQRWSDGPYLTRIIFCEMVKGHEGDERGFGISAAECDGYVKIYVHAENQTVEVIDHNETTFKGSLEDFIKS